MAKSPSRPADSLLVNPGKSSRLQEMRQRAATANQPAPAPAQPSFQEKDGDVSPELALARQLIDQHLTEILAALPAGKQRRLFKIRFGIEPEQIKELAIKQIIALLEINHPQFNNLSANMKRIADLNYNGRQSN
ncbi:MULTISPECIES: hypothetical protein [Methylomonas]|uniref:Uncharacterized protein n=2 Tax=Methylomonas TaxID=416 RepID=A0A126T7X4_9GAMM|nr:MULTISPECIES: hypothetical protein [Methylomonas]AMK78172.1 hypothetical protein JT25_017060 [Methylomonas denitrificans]OAI03894.1 hypothetical protein A1342_04995 [Methylomonas methanica]TCV87800.1 hypothetical protein EDE11_102305 [Methylomonas methanica]